MNRVSVSLDGHSGVVYNGRLEVIVEKPTDYLAEVKRWMDISVQERAFRERVGAQARKLKKRRSHESNR